jgi:hypothetical protein
MEAPQKNRNIESSFRDPNGFLFYQNGIMYRQINISYKKNYDRLMHSGLYKTLTEAELLIPHDEVQTPGYSPEKCYKIIKPERIPFISYPYSWCFSQMKDAALVMLDIQKKAFDFGMSLKDCSSYNIQFRRGRPILIDTLSFEEYREGEPWVAYRQFCQHFLAPLALMSIKDIRLNQLLRVYLDGIPLDLASNLLKFHLRNIFPLLIHIHLHAKAQKHFADRAVEISRRTMSRFSFMGLLDNLENTVKKIKWKVRSTEWIDYYEKTNYSPEGLQHKKQIVDDFLNMIHPKIVWDLGANIGIFSRIAAKKGSEVISFDFDTAAVEINYIQCKERRETKILPLLLDLTNPSPGIGWENKERMSLFERGPTDTVLALAMIHHLAISNNLPFNKIVDFFSSICISLIIEFVPKEDSQVQRLLAIREDIFPNFTQQVFEREFKRIFMIQSAVRVKDSLRTLYLMTKNKQQ